MKTKIIKIFLILCCAVFFVPLVTLGDETFQIQAPMTVTKPGLVETLLPPELHRYSASGLDLRVLGPEGQTRALELYWGREKKETMVTLANQSIQIVGKGRVQWIGYLKNPLRVRAVHIYVPEDRFVGKVDISVRQGNAWKTLVRNAGVFNPGTQANEGEVPLPEGVYRYFKLDFISYDRNFRQKLVSVDRVDVRSVDAGIGDVEKNLPLTLNRIDIPGETDLSAVLRGSGIFIKQLELTTDAPFTGDWLLEREEIGTGKRTWVSWKRGHVEELGKGFDRLVMDVGERVRGKNLRLRLFPSHYFGKVNSWVLVARLPRLVFRAEAPNVYQIQAGCGEGIAVLDEPTSNRGALEELYPGPASLNPRWKAEDFVNKYHLEGGPFDSKGYAWEAPISVSAPGYYRLDLNQQASLNQGGIEQDYLQGTGPENSTRGLRIIRHDTQVPYFVSQGEFREVVAAAVEDYDRIKNTSVWTLSLPQASNAWIGMALESRGVFERQVEVEKKNPVTLVWEPLTKLQWNAPQDQSVRLAIPLNALGDSTEIRITIAHGDNHPIVLSKIAFYYQAPALCFLADAAGDYVLMGGNPDAAEPHYDLSLIEDSLLENEPQPVSMGDVRVFKGQGMKLQLFRAFEGSHWGLYAVLILVTLGMIFIVIRLFPAISDCEIKKK